MYTENFFESADGLQLFYRDYEAGDSTLPPLVCMHGLTRNSSDFDDFATHFAGQRRMLVPDTRGRGRSEHDSQWQNYHLLTYVADTWRLLDQLGIDEVILLGSSMGGLMSMYMAQQQPERIRGVILNDIGPELAPEGIARIFGYMEAEQESFTLDEAMKRIMDVNAPFFPKYDANDWMDFTRRIYQEVEPGRYQTAYDKGITRALVEPAVIPDDPWVAFQALRDKPVLVVRGMLSDLLSLDIVARMRAVIPGLQHLEVADRGHHPSLNEPECVAAIKDFLNSLER